MQFKLFVPCMWIHWHYQVNNWHSLAVTTSDAAYFGEFGDRVRPTSVKFSLHRLFSHWQRLFKFVFKNSIKIVFSCRPCVRLCPRLPGGRAWSPSQ